jgi:hypothetical protein
LDGLRAGDGVNDVANPPGLWPRRDLNEVRFVRGIASVASGRIELIFYPVGICTFDRVGSTGAGRDALELNRLRHRKTKEAQSRRPCRRRTRDLQRCEANRIGRDGGLRSRELAEKDTAGRGRGEEKGTVHNCEG